MSEASFTRLIVRRLAERAWNEVAMRRSEPSLYEEQCSRIFLVVLVATIIVECFEVEKKEGKS